MYPDIRFDEGGTLKEVNADVRIKGPGFSVKFHNQSLEYVMKYLDESSQHGHSKKEYRKN